MIDCLKREEDEPNEAERRSTRGRCSEDAASIALAVALPSVG